VGNLPANTTHLAYLETFDKRLLFELRRQLSALAVFVYLARGFL